MAYKELLNIDNIARKKKKEYENINNVARKTKKAYVNISGIARKCFGNDGVLYDYGDECSDVTGGWTFPSIRTSGWQCFFDTNVTVNNHYSTITQKTYTRSKNDNSMSFNIAFGKTTLLYGDASSGDDVLVRSLGAYTSKKIDLTKYSTLHFLVDMNVDDTCHDDETYIGLPTDVIFAVRDESPTSVPWADSPLSYCQAHKEYDGVNVTNQEVTLDVSSLSGEYYIMVDARICKNRWGTIRMVWVNEAHSNLTIKKIWLT